MLPVTPRGCHVQSSLLVELLLSFFHFFFKRVEEFVKLDTQGRERFDEAPISTLKEKYYQFYKRMEGLLSSSSYCVFFCFF